MELEKVIQKNVFQRLRTLVLGKEKPNFLTRVSVGLAFVIWIYLFSWHLFTILSLTLLNSLKHPEKVKATFNSVGYKYGYTDTMNLLKAHSLIEIILYIVVFVGLILIWRKKKIGFLIYIFGNLATLLATFLIMGWSYFSLEVPIIDILLTLCACLYFGVGAMFIYKWKSKKEQNQES